MCGTNRGVLSFVHLLVFVFIYLYAHSILLLSPAIVTIIVRRRLWSKSTTKWDNSSNFKIETGTHSFNAEKLVIAGGLMTTKLAKMVGMEAPVIPERGQILVSERTSRVFYYPTARIREKFAFHLACVKLPIEA